MVLMNSHRHIDWHVILGMIAQFVEAPEVLQEITVVPQEIVDQCAIQGVDLQIPAANREQVKSGTKGNIGLRRLFMLQFSWKKVVEMWFGVFRV